MVDVLIEIRRRNPEFLRMADVFISLEVLRIKAVVDTVIRFLERDEQQELVRNVLKGWSTQLGIISDNVLWQQARETLLMIDYKLAMAYCFDEHYRKVFEYVHPRLSMLIDSIEAYTEYLKTPQADQSGE